MAGDQASPLEVLVPVMSIYFFVYTGLMLFSIMTGEWWFRTKIRNKLRLKKRKCTATLLTKRDIFIAEMYVSHQNNPESIVKMIFPAVISLAWCPIILFFAPLLFEVLWPDEYPNRPDVNEGIASFLGVAGLICAITYGYAFDGALKQRIPAKVILKKRRDALRILLNLVGKANFFTTAQKAGVILKMKKEQILWMKLVVQWRRKEKREHPPEFRGIIKDYLHVQGGHEGEDLNVRFKMAEIWDQVEVITECNAEAVILTLKTKVTALHWVFLIVLGYVSCVGIMFVTMSSYKVDLMFSLLFLVIIFIFLYLVADMDNPSHGLIKVNMKDNFDCLAAMENWYTTVLLSDLEATGVPPNLAEGDHQGVETII